MSERACFLLPSSVRALDHEPRGHSINCGSAHVRRLNGGPGSSSLIGLLTENGPWQTDEQSLLSPLPWGVGEKVPQLFHRPHGWQRAASYIWLESPAGVGFSYCDYPLNKTTNKPLFPCTANDTSTAHDNHAVLQAFFKGFPEFAENEFFITGESYAGIYIPTLAELILTDTASTINLQGVAVGNGCWGSTVGLCSFGPDMQRIWQMFLFGHSAISSRSYRAIVKACGDPAGGEGAWSNCSGQGPACSGPYASMLRGSDSYRSYACQVALNNVQVDEGQGNYEIYNYYDTCYATSGMLADDTTLDILHTSMLSADTLNTTGKIETPHRRRTMGGAERTQHLAHLRSGGEFGAAVHVGHAPLTSGGALNDYSCGGMSAMAKWLSHPAVMEALHVNSAHPYPGACAYGPRERGDLRPLYKQLASKIRVLIFSGDTDACVPTIGTEEWTSGLGFPVYDNWRPWHAGTNQNDTDHFVTAGYVTVFNAAITPSRVVSANGTCPLFGVPNCSIAAGSVVGFSTERSADSCCDTCGASTLCKFYHFRIIDSGCTLYSAVDGLQKGVADNECGSYTPPPHNFTFLTIKGAGHTVPEFKPVPALAMITRFFRGEGHE